MKSIVGIYRASQFSPNMEDSDAAILNAVADRLRQSGHEVTCVREREERLRPKNDIACEASVKREEIELDLEGVDVVLTMGRLMSTLDLLQEVESKGVKVINSSIAIRHCERKRFTQILMDEDVPFAQSRVFQSSDNITWDLFPCWLKKGEGYAEVAEDVVFVRNTEELAAQVNRMRQRGIATLVVSQHLEGDLIKFYGVAPLCPTDISPEGEVGKGAGFFFWFYASDRPDKFGNNPINHRAQGYRFSERALQEICNHAATVIGLEVYGGDCVVSDDGTIQLIDINDWPSFSRCREQAAEKIIRLIGY